MAMRTTFLKGGDTSMADSMACVNSPAGGTRYLPKRENLVKMQ